MIGFLTPQAFAERRLNNLVTVLLEKARVDTGKELTIENPRAGWVYIGLDVDGEAETNMLVTNNARCPLFVDRIHEGAVQ